MAPTYGYDEIINAKAIDPGSLRMHSGRVLVRPIEPEEKQGSIYVPEAYAMSDNLSVDMRRPWHGEVVSMGDCETLNDCVSVGDRIVWGRYGSDECKIG